MRGVRALRGELQRHLFAGTLDEVRPLLAHEAIAAGRPALIAADDQLRFAMTWQDAADTERCPRKGLRMRYAISGPSPKVLTPTPEQSETILREGSFCFERP